MARVSLVERQFAAFLRTPLSVRKGMAVIVTATTLVVVLGGIVITVVDPQEFPDIGTGLWWALQTVTTVGYGDVTPSQPIGRAVGAFIMLEAIAFVAIVTAAMTSSFVERARRERATRSEAEEQQGIEQIAAQLAAIRADLESIHGMLELMGRRDASPPPR